MADSLPRTVDWRQALFNRRMLICVFTGFSSGLPLYILLSLLPASVVSALVANIGLSLWPFPAKLAPAPIFSVWHESRRNDAGHRWLRDMVASEFTRQAQGQ